MRFQVRETESSPTGAVKGEAIVLYMGIMRKTTNDKKELDYKLCAQACYSDRTVPELEM